MTTTNAQEQEPFAEHDHQGVILRVILARDTLSMAAGVFGDQADLTTDAQKACSALWLVERELDQLYHDLCVAEPSALQCREG